MKAATFTPVALAEAVARLESMPVFLATALSSVPASEVAWQPAPGEFSLVEHACHLRDLEREGYLVRVRRMLSEDRPALVGFDGGAIAAARDYLSQDAAGSARAFAATRRELLELVRPLTPAQLAREGTFGGEPVCLADVISMMVAHDREHRDEIERLLAKLGS